MASSGLNRVQLLGNVGKDPETKYTANNSAVCNFSLATSESWKDKASGEPREATEWHRVVIFGKLAEIAGQYLSKGSKVYLEGQLKTRKWTDKSGADRYSTEVVLSGFDSKMVMLGDGSGGKRKSEPRQQDAFDRGGRETPSASPEPEFDDDIPF